GYTLALVDSRHDRSDRNEVRMWPAAVRRLHDPSGRGCRPLLWYACIKRCIEKGHDHRRAFARIQSPSADGLDCRTGAAVRILSVRPIDVRCRAARKEGKTY